MESEVQGWLSKIEVYMLEIIEARTLEEGWSFSLRAFDEIPKEVARGFLRDMRSRGLVEFNRGLFREDGEVGGSGYAITRKGREWLKQQLRASDG